MTEDLLAEARRAVETGEWVAAGHAFVRAAMAGSLDGANGAVAVTRELKPLADEGRADAAALLAGILLDYFDESALPMAVAYARQAADAGDPAGQRTYGFMLVNGQGVAEDRDHAAELFRAAADAGDGYAAFNLGQMRVDADRGEALRLLELAAGRGVVDAGAVLGDRLSDEDRDEEALRWYVWAAERGHTKAMYAAACWYRDGFGTAPDPVQAIRWYLAMFAHGDGNGIHDAIELAKQVPVGEEQIRHAGDLAGDPGMAQALINTLAGKRVPGH
ncbi:tetratricopeptide repeat protein [Streptomyces coeruleoprunus]|uniref:Tetratricopeptide repeat protein n=1 Tax=Streptomyces coeruleoprunus TaxID=285563 RepID=A0ABV9XKB3_9ACTN